MQRVYAVFWQKSMKRPRSGQGPHQTIGQEPRKTWNGQAKAKPLKRNHAGTKNNMLGPTALQN